MNSQTSRKIIVAGGMAAVVVAGVAIFALRSHPATSQGPPPPSAAAEIPGAPPVAGAPQTPGAPPVAAAQTPGAPPVAGAQTPGAPPASAAQIPAAAPPAAAQTPAAPAAVAHNDRVASKSADTATASAAEPKVARNRHPAKASTSAVATKGTDTRSGSAADTSEKPAAETVASSVDPVKSAELTMPPAPSSPAADDQKAGTSMELAAADSQITTDVKSGIAGDSLSKDANIGVTTTHGVVALTGKLASQDAIDHVKDVAGKVKDVKSVDASALVLASL